MKGASDLEQSLARIDGRGYKAYRDIVGAYRLGDLSLFIDHVQSDPFAPPSKLRLRLPLSATQIPSEWTGSKLRRTALGDFLARRFKKAIQRGAGAAPTRIFIDAGGEEVLERTAVVVTELWVEARIEAGLPAAGRRIRGKEAARLLLDVLPGLAERSLILSPDELEKAAFFWKTVENQEAIRTELPARGLVAFIADGSILPRESGVSDRALRKDRCVPFQSPDTLKVTFEVPHPICQGQEKRSVTGMGIPAGVTLIAGGGYHGKSTLLRALERCVYPHVPGDGREYVVTVSDAVKVRAEDRRRIERVDISPFINNLPNGEPTDSFSTDEASGSTSQAAAIVEAVEAGATLLLVDEDTSATNFMVRDSRMQALVDKEHEPITPFVDRVRQLYEHHGVSTILIMGGSGDYFDVADRVIVMSAYRPIDRTEEARRIALENPNRRADPPPPPAPFSGERVPLANSVDPSFKGKRAKIEARTPEHLRFGSQDVDLRAVEQLVDPSQTRAAGYCLYLLARRFMNADATVPALLDALDLLLEQEGLDILNPHSEGKSDDERQHPGNFARPRRHEIAAALNRLRSLRIRSKPALDGLP